MKCWPVFIYFIINIIWENINNYKYFVLFGQDASIDTHIASEGVQRGGIAVGLTVPAENAQSHTEF